MRVREGGGAFCWAEDGTTAEEWGGVEKVVPLEGALGERDTHTHSSKS